MKERSEIWTQFMVAVVCWECQVCLSGQLAREVVACSPSGGICWVSSSRPATADQPSRTASAALDTSGQKCCCCWPCLAQPSPAQHSSPTASIDGIIQGKGVSLGKIPCLLPFSNILSVIKAVLSGHRPRSCPQPGCGGQPGCRRYTVGLFQHLVHLTNNTVPATQEKQPRFFTHHYDFF